VVRVGTFKGSTISQHGCSTSGALATGALQKEEEEEEEEEEALCFKGLTHHSTFPMLQRGS
jgi:hypothetical protein